MLHRRAGSSVARVLLALVGAAVPSTAAFQAPDRGCVECHAGIEEMHPEAGLSCVDCHGGDGGATSKEQAHVRGQRTQGEDESVAPLDEDLAWLRFRNPMDLRVMKSTCAECHGDACANLLSSLHGTTAGHLSDGYYEMGLFRERGSRYSVFPISEAPKPGGAVSSLEQPPPFQKRLPRSELSTHFTDLPRKECMQCHLWSEGRAVRGRVGFDGDYRGAGCAACHVQYSLDGLSQSADRHAVRTEPGHPRVHAMTAAPTTQTCSSCHYGDASIGLHFRGLSQLPPNAPGGPRIPGTTDALMNRVFYLNDPAVVPPDVHHEKGMHCIDCHTLGDVMGDGRLHGQMEHAVEISCTACHGTFEEVSRLQTERGTPLRHLSWDGKQVTLRSKVDGREHVVPQVVHVLDAQHEAYNAEAARAMTPDHARVECYTCHAGWNVNFLGFHFSRHEQLTQLDLLSGKRTPGRVTTQEKVFSTWKSFYAGLNERGAVAPYLTGFSTMGSVWDEEGELFIDQAMPVTSAGLSGLTMVHHQPHSTRPTARSCVECHRTSTTWGMGSPNFRLARQLAFVADRRGIEVVALDRAEPARSLPLAKLPVPDVVDLVAHVDVLQGQAHHLYVAEGGCGVHVIDVRDPVRPRRAAFLASIDPRGLELAGDVLYVADGVGGLRLYDVSKPEEPRRLGQVPMFEAQDVHVSWPWAHVADGPAGLCIVDVRDPAAPRLLSELDLNGDSRLANEALQVESLFQYSRPTARRDGPSTVRTKARHLCAVLDRTRGLYLVDVTEPEAPRLLYPEPDGRTRARPGNPTYRGLALLSQVDLADPNGGERTLERDYAYVMFESDAGDLSKSSIALIDVTDPERVPARRTRLQAGYSSEQLVLADFYSPPTRRRLALVPGSRGLFLGDLTTSREPSQAGTIASLVDAYAVAVEEFPLDRMVDEKGRPEKDISHEPSRWLRLEEIERVLSVPAERLWPLDERPTGPANLSTVRLHLMELDEDGSGTLEGGELERGGASSADADGDGRVTLAELAASSGAMGEERTEGDPGRIAVLLPGQGVLGGLLDAVNPFDFDRDRKDGLSRAEAEKAFFAALDLDGDGELSLDETSRRPAYGDLRHGDARARKAFRELDRNGNGSLSAREFSLEDDEWKELDQDGDGTVRLVAPDLDVQRSRGLVLSGSEWPVRRSGLYLLPPNIGAERLLQVFDEDGDGALDQRELRARPDLLRQADRNGDGRAAADELDRVLRAVSNEGVHVLPDDFLGRWDLDGDGRVDAGELPRTVRLRLRLE